ncbi:Alpha/Beta hydrolase protein [Cercophora newfieldiana]|uniref:Alpha/Beta hydrolase protein n=1 Tax=Cercophora newfieldiana TaxID=92897 RepID=A0AA39XWD7_9PEZI|nr:Alpha/Beta hydrolase protein [Cercophora newfieldiana]
MAAPPSPSPTYTPLYATLPLTPQLPPARFSGTAPINNISLFYTLHGAPLPPLNSKPNPNHLPILLLHGGKISSRWYAHQITHLTRTHPHRPIIALDTRAHGRSTDDLSVPLSYTLFASDAAALLSHLGVSRVAIIGWSDGANTALQMAMSHASFVDRIFAFGANYQPDQLNVTGLLGMPFLGDLAGRMKSEYEELSPTPEGYDTFASRMEVMQGALPAWGAADFAGIKTLYQEPRTAPIVWVVDGAEEEIVMRRVPGEIRDMIWGSSLVLLPDVGHFAPLQDPGTFNALLDQWLARKRA